MPPRGKAGASGASSKKGGAAKRRVKRNIPRGVATVKSTFNNTIVSISDPEGNVLAWSSGGVQGFKGSKKSTPFAATLSAQSCARKVLDMGMKTVEVYTRGPGSGRESAIRGLMASGLDLTIIRDVTAIPHNGCRPKKRRRV
ncbi:MAG: 30S ribosomal protein S11 [bacterium]|nr:30S ribosomal protein S11 [bacterium]